jgi:DNA-binding response OmpR family regulator
MAKILIVEDEDSIRMALEDDFSFEGYEVITAANGPDGLVKGKDESLDLILLDVMLPEMSGFEICKKLREKNVNTPIIMLTAKSQEIDKVLGLEYGADDYVTKPYSSRELHARVKSNLRRSKFNLAGDESLTNYSFGDCDVDFETYECKKNSNLLSLTTSEFLILKYLILNAGKVVKRQNLLDNVWGDDIIVTPRTIDTHVANLRKKIENNSANPDWILSVRGVGYKFKK